MASMILFDTATHGTSTQFAVAWLWCERNGTEPGGRERFTELVPGFDQRILASYKALSYFLGWVGGVAWGFGGGRVVVSLDWGGILRLGYYLLLPEKIKIDGNR